MFTKADLRRLIIPLIVEQILVVLVGMVDTAMVSTVGEAAMSGVSLVDMINNLLLSMFAALATGGAVVASQLIGAKKPDEACFSANQLILVVLAISSAIMLLTLAGREWLLKLIYRDVEPEVMRCAVTYFWINALSYPFIALYSAGAAIFRAMNRSSVAMRTSALMNCLNIAGNAVCIYGLRMGVEGVAIPTLISRVIAAGLILHLCFDPHNQVHLLRGRFRPDLPMIRRILNIGVPNGIETSLFQLGRVLVVSIISTFGTVQIAANAVANNIDLLGVLPGQAMSLAMITVIGQCVGAQDFEQVRFYVRKLMKITYLSVAAVCAFTLVTLPLLLRLYSLTADTSRLAAILILIHNGCAIVFWPISFTLPNALRASNDAKYTMYVAVFSMVMFRILFSYILGIGLGWGAIGVWWAMVLDWIFRDAMFLWRYKSGRWEQFAREK